MQKYPLVSPMIIQNHVLKYNFLLAVLAKGSSNAEATTTELARESPVNSLVICQIYFLLPQISYSMTYSTNTGTLVSIVSFKTLK
uniref:Putative ovule protein n=1 Tax=Solanum chacoense TaxID=4108 RepID=A0A0V0IP20_SOLCH